MAGNRRILQHVPGFYGVRSAFRVRLNIAWARRNSARIKRFSFPLRANMRIRQLIYVNRSFRLDRFTAAFAKALSAQ